jgi:hypothetical protein
VVPIILRPCDWQHSPLKDLQCLPRDGKAVTEWDNPDAAFLDIQNAERESPRLCKRGMKRCSFLR